MRQDLYVESVVRKVVSYLAEVLESQAANIEEHLQVANKTGYRAYLERFSWDHAKYPTRQSLRDLVEHIVKEVNNIESELKTKSQDYTSLKNSLQSFERQQTGSLINRELDGIVNKKHFAAQGSEYFETVVVVVPNSLTSDWEKTYETIIPDKIVPRSSEKIFADNDHTLYTCTLFASQSDVFKVKCREKKFIVRNYTYDEKQMAKTKERQKELEQKKDRQHRNLLPWLKIQFGETFSSWLHIKALRLFVESVLRFGLPVNFTSALLCPKPKSAKKLRDLLSREFDKSENRVSAEDVELSRQLGFQTEEFYPYVYYNLKVDFAAQVAPSSFK
jgi:V-type H+-transporting ATPase subunit C